jgi:hypothetical protein
LHLELGDSNEKAAHRDKLAALEHFEQSWKKQCDELVHSLQVE